jgi:hypothetical protein
VAWILQKLVSKSNSCPYTKSFDTPNVFDYAEIHQALLLQYSLQADFLIGKVLVKN